MTPAALSLLLLLRGATNIHDAHEHAVDAVKAGATSDEVSQAITEWMQLQARQVQQVFAGPPRRDCCTGIERHQPVRCLCGGLESQHGKDRRGRPTCFHSFTCACTEHRSAGKADPTDTDIRLGDRTA